MLIIVTGGSGSGKSAIAENYALELCRRRREEQQMQDSPHFTAENHTSVDLSGAEDKAPCRLIYLATMRSDPSDPETVRRIERHRKMRAGKGFQTVECPYGIREYVDAELKTGFCGDSESGPDSPAAHTVYLLEDLPNLLANEMWEKNGALNSLLLHMPVAEKAQQCEEPVQCEDPLQCEESQQCEELLQCARDAVMKPLLTLAGYSSCDNREQADGEERLCSHQRSSDRHGENAETLTANPGPDLVVVTGELSSDGSHYDAFTEQYLSLLGELGADLAERADLAAEAVCGIPIAVASERCH